MVSLEKEASGLCLFHKLYGVQVVGGSNPLTPTLDLKQVVRPPNTSEKLKVAESHIDHLIRWE